MLVTERIKSKIKEECLHDLRSAGILDIDKDINAASDIDYIANVGLSEFVGITKSELMQRFNNVKDADEAEFDKLSTLIRAANKLSIYWVLCNGVRFILDFDSILKKDFQVTQQLLKSIEKSKAEDFVFDFYGDDIRYQCKFQKQHDLLKVNGKFYSNYVFSYSRLSDDDQCGTFELCIIPDLFPKVFAINTPTGVCNECGICKQVNDCWFKHTDDSLDDTMKVYRMSKNVQHTLQSGCMYNQVNDEFGPFISHDIIDFFNVCMYALDKYVNRKVIVRQARDHELDSHLKLAVPKETNPSEITFVTIKDRVIYERKQKRKSHDHHASPREHVRRETERHLKDGRVIKVRSCVINKGKGDVKKQTVYTVS